MNGNVDEDSIYLGADTSYPEFQRFLDLAQEREDLLPLWWNKSKRAACLQLERRRGYREELSRSVDKSDIVEHRGNPTKPMNLRALSEKVYGSGVMGYGV